MKKILCLALAAMMLISLSSVAFAADRENAMPDVFVNGTKVEFAGQGAVIVDSRTLVPVRGVFESMGCSVEWDEKTYTVTVTAENKEKSVSMVIGDKEMKITGDPKKTSYTLDVPSQLINDRTMIPLRAVSEAFGCIVVWNDKSYSAYITSTLMESDSDVNFSDIFASIMEENNKPKPELSLSTDADDVKDGDVITVYVDVKNIPEGCAVSGILAAFEFDKTKLEYVEDSGTLLADGKEAMEASLKSENVKYDRGAIAAFITLDTINVTDDNQHIFKASFKVNDVNGANLKLSDADTGFSLKNGDKDVWYGEKNINVSSSELTFAK